MKFDYQKYPSLESFGKRNQPEDISIYLDDDLSFELSKTEFFDASLDKLLSSYGQQLAPRVIYFSDAIIRKASYKNDALWDKLFEAILELPNEDNLILFPLSAWPKRTDNPRAYVSVVLHPLDFEGVGFNQTRLILVLLGEELYDIAVLGCSSKDKYKVLFESLMPNDSDSGSLALHFGMLAITCLVIKHFVECETVIVNEVKSKKAKVNGIKYSSKIPLDIEVIDSTWFTTFIQTGKFNVRGHFRLQPCGEGLQSKRLIWINEYEKSGYTRIAKKEKT